MTNVVSEEECRDTNGDGDCVNCTRNPWLCPKKGVYLDKWPRLIVVGDRVTEEQAKVAVAQEDYTLALYTIWKLSEAIGTEGSMGFFFTSMSEVIAVLCPEKMETHEPGLHERWNVAMEVAGGGAKIWDSQS